VAARQEEGWWRVGIRGVVGGGAPRDRGVPCGEGLGGVGTGVWRGGARTVRAVHGDRRGGGWRRKGTRGVVGGGTRGPEGWRRAWLVWGLTGGHAREEEHEECQLRWPSLLVPSQPMGIKSVELVHVPTLLS
jgi:hypothetical protein